MVEKNALQGWWPEFFEPLRQLGANVAEWFAPRAEAAQSDGAYVVTVEIPGVKPDDVEVTFHDGTLLVKGEKKLETHKEGDGFYFSERQYGRFQRSFRVPPDVDGSKVAAKIEGGLLTVTLPKRADAAGGARKISVSAG